VKAGHYGSRGDVAHLVTEDQAEAVLAELGPLGDSPPIDHFREQLEATVATIWASNRAARHYRAVDEAFRLLRRAMQRAKAELQAMEKSSAAPEMANYVGLLKLDEVRAALVLISSVERDLSRIPAVFSGRQKRRMGRATRPWYSGFIRDLAEIAEGFGIAVTTGGDRSDDPHATPFTRFVFAVEKLLPSGESSKTLSACAKRIDRAICASEDEIDEAVPRKGEPRKVAGSRLIAALTKLSKS
jgi:hypothetical protein